MTAFENMSAVPAGCYLHELSREGRMHEPRIHAGGIVVVDPNDCEIIDGEFYAILQMSGPIVWQMIRRDEYKWDREGPLYSLVPANRPGSYEELHEWMAAGHPVYVGDGPVGDGYLAENILGRVIGIMTRVLQTGP